MKNLLVLILTVLLVCMPASAGTLSMHIAVGDYLGEQSQTKVEAFLLGVASHAVLDSLPRHQYVVNWQNAQSLRKDMDVLLLDGVLSLTRTLEAVRSGDETRLWGVIGAVMPDIVDGLYALHCRECWMRGELLLPWHQSEKMKPRLTKGETMLSILAVQIAF